MERLGKNWGKVAEQVLALITNLENWKSLTTGIVACGILYIDSSQFFYFVSIISNRADETTGSEGCSHGLVFSVVNHQIIKY